MYIYNFKIAEINFRFLSNIQIPRIDTKKYLNFFTNNEISPDIIIRIKKIKIESKKNYGLSKDSFKLLFKRFKFIKNDFDSYFFYCSEVCERLEEVLKIDWGINIIQIDNFLRVFDFNNNIIDIFLAGDEIKYENNHYPCEYFIAANLRLIFSSLLTSFSAIMLHCSGLIMKSGAALFFAPNEGGKSTVVLLSKNRFPILNDDQIIIKKEKKTIFAHGTPFGAFNSGPQKAKISGIFFLEQSEKFEIKPISKTDIIQCIWGEHIRYTHFLPNWQKKIAFNILFDAFHQAPVYKMFFQKDYIDWEAIDSAIANAK